LGIGDWGLGIGDWGLGDWAQSPIPNPQSPIPNTKTEVLIIKDKAKPKNTNTDNTKLISNDNTVNNKNINLDTSKSGIKQSESSNLNSDSSSSKIIKDNLKETNKTQNLKFLVSREVPEPSGNPNESIKGPTIRINIYLIIVSILLLG